MEIPNLTAMFHDVLFSFRKKMVMIWTTHCHYLLINYAGAFHWLRSNWPPMILMKHLSSERVVLEKFTKLWLAFQVQNPRFCTMMFMVVNRECIEALRIELDIIKVATQNFSEDNKIRQGATDSMYKGRLQNGQGIVVKRFHRYSQQALRECINEVSLLAKLEHENVVQLLGHCMEGTQVLLVYALAVYASLDHLMFDFATRVLLDWNRRHKILLGVALGLRYIHNHAPFWIVHCDLKPANILLEESLNPRISDFGLATTCENNETGRHVARTREHSPTPDVFSFGLLILEIIRGQRSNEDFIHYAWTNWWKGTASNIIDPTMDVDSSIITRYIQIGLLCVQQDEAERPTMDEVIVMLLRGSSLTLQIPKEPVMVSAQSTHDSNEYEDLETLEPNDENDLLIDDHCFEISDTVQDFIEELNLNPR